MKKIGTGGVWGGKEREGRKRRVLFKRSAQENTLGGAKDVAARSREPKRLFFLIVVFDFSSAATGRCTLPAKSVGESTSGRRLPGESGGGAARQPLLARAGFPPPLSDERMTAAAPIYFHRLDRRPKTRRAAGTPRANVELARFNGD